MAFNSAQYSWADVKVIMLGREVTGLQGVKYKVARELEEVRGRGNDPLALQRGNKSYDGSIMLLQSEVEALEVAVAALDPNYDLTDVQFDIIVTYGDGGVSHTDTVQGVVITEYEKGINQGDKYMKIELPFKALGIKRKA